MAKMLVELENLRGGKDTITLNIVVRPNRTESFPWTTDAETTTISKFEKAIYAVYQDKDATSSRSLETPTKKYSDFILKEVNSLYAILNMETLNMSDLPPFTSISTESLDSKEHKESLRRLLEELDSKIRAIPSDTFANEAICSTYVCSFLMHAVLIFNGELSEYPL
ncbi:hypothetical protein BGZ88_003309 [Linnemannia elongata]|nr:hypothetical protein BGZ88_003309 [Linnemannia elongata]